MPDNANAPGSAAGSAGDPPAGQAASGSQAAGATPAGTEQMPAWAKTLLNSVESYRNEQANLRSLHDRQMNALRQSLTSPSRGGRGAAAETATGDDPAAGGNGNENGRASHRNPALEEQMALIEFRQLNPDWQDYWADMAPILADQVKAAPYVITSVDERGEVYVDYRRSLAAVKSALELARLRQRQSEFDQSRANSQAGREAARRDATISGGGATGAKTLPEIMAEVNKLTGDDRTRRLYELAPELFDPNDLPKALRK